MTNYRVIWLSEDQCILFNSLEKRVSTRVAADIGRAAEFHAEGLEINHAMDKAGVRGEDRRKTAELLTFMKGSLKSQPIHIGEHHFHNVLVLCPAGNCNLGCVYCSGTSGTDKSNQMDMQLALDAVNYYFDHVGPHSLYTLQFHGAGEPLVNFDVVRQSVELARELCGQRNAKLWVRLTTNGVCSREAAEWVARNADHVSLSLDGPAEIQNLQRPTIAGHGTYDNVLRTLRIFQQAGVLKRMNTVITPNSLDRMIDVVHHLGQLGGIPELRLLPMAFCGRCEITGMAPLDAAKYDAQFDQAVKVAASYGIKVVNLIQEIDYHTDHYCGACGFNMVVAPNGNVSTCVEVLTSENAGADELIVGRYNADTRRFKIDWEKLNSLRGRTWAISDQCASCSFKTNCAGNCLVRAARSTGTVMKADPECCEMVRSVLPRAIAEMADGNISNLMYSVVEDRGAPAP